MVTNVKLTISCVEITMLAETKSALSRFQDHFS